MIFEWYETTVFMTINMIVHILHINIHLFKFSME